MIKETGIVRRVDELGRVVIPREIRRKVGLKDGDPVEIALHAGDRGLEVVLVPYSSTLANRVELLRGQVLDNLQDHGEWDMLAQVNQIFDRLGEMLNKKE